MAGGVQVGASGVAVGADGVIVVGSDSTTCCCTQGATCYVKPRNCYTDQEHPLFVVPCTDHYYVFQIAGLYDCWYVDTDFTQYTSVPTGYSALPAPTEVEDCDTCRNETPTSSCEDCLVGNDELFNDGDVMIVTWFAHGFDVGVCPGGADSGVEILYFNSGTGLFEGTGALNGNAISWDHGSTPACTGLCRYFGTIDGPGTTASGSYYCEGSLFAANTDTTNVCTGGTQQHNCFSPPPPGGDFANVRVDISVSVFPTGQCFNGSIWTAGIQDEQGCCA